ncbi:hypothetical protein [Vibrio sp. ECSMB14106]|uniref:hypothetical protein n=1 Tax=Vibrio sp. ECSMB14106 TaxID=1638949 RepID=UPI001E4EEC4A|nr:hypothetical protein [Vibrio sp. ECSMB14106]
MDSFIQNAATMKQAANAQRLSILQFGEQALYPLNNTFMLMVGRNNDCPLANKDAKHLNAIEQFRQLLRAHVNDGHSPTIASTFTHGELSRIAYPDNNLRVL